MAPLILFLLLFGTTIAIVAWTRAPASMQGPLIALCGTVLTATVTILGWYGAYTFAKQKEDHARRLEISLKYRERQIGELYGPLLSLIQQIFNVWDVRENILNHSQFNDDERTRVREFV
jgi:hypothetical protein